MSNKQAVIEQLQRIVAQKGGKKSGKKAELNSLGEIDPNYRNQYINDGSMVYKKTRLAVIDEILDKVYGVSGLAGAELQKMRATVPESDINQTMAKLAKMREKEIKALRENDKKALSVYNEIENQAKPLRVKNNLTKLKDYKMDDKAVLTEAQLRNKLEFDDYDVFDALNKKGKTAAEALIAKQETDRKAYEAIADSLKRVGYGSGLSGGKKRAPSKYNLFVRAYMKKHKNASLADAARAWKAE